MNALTLLILILVFWTIKELVLGVLVRKRRKELAHKLRVECALRHFAEARNNLVELALTKKIDAHSSTFKMLHQLNTVIMRRPDAYPEISAMLRYMFLKESKGDVNTTFSAESKSWSPEVRQVVRQTADAMGFLVIDYSRVMRFLYRFEKRIDPTASPHRMLKELSSRLAKSKEKKDPVVKNIRNSQKAMYKLSEAY